MQVIFMDTLLHAISLAVAPSSSAEITKEAIEYVTSFLLPPFSLDQGADFKTGEMELGGMKHQEGMTKWLLDLVALIKGLLLFLRACSSQLFFFCYLFI